MSRARQQRQRRPVLTDEELAQRRAKVAELTALEMSGREIAVRLGISRDSVVRDQRANREAAQADQRAHTARTPGPACAEPDDSARTTGESVRGDARTGEEGVRAAEQGVRAAEPAVAPDERTVHVIGAAATLPQLAAQPRAHPLIVQLSAAVRGARQADPAGWHPRATSDHVLGALVDVVHLALRTDPVDKRHAQITALHLRRLAALLTKRADALEHRAAGL